MNNASAWLTLITSLPGQNTAARVRVWRALKASGAAALRDGVYLLPRTLQNETVFREQAQEIEAAGGDAHLAEYHPLEGEAPGEDLTRLFDRTAEYADLLRRLDAFKLELASASEAEARRAIAALRREFAAVTETDFFPGPSRTQVEQALADAEAAINARFSPDEPHAAPGALRRHAQTDYQGKTWATRTHLWIDRVASAWLIRRFIDPQSRFLWLKDVTRRPKNAIGFDFDGAEFSHVGTRVTFEILAFSFGYENDPAIARLGALVHYLDVGGVPVPEAAGFAAIMAGARAQAKDDDELLTEIGKTLDYLYAAYSEGGHATSKT
jgi:hypothetical protein